MLWKIFTIFRWCIQLPVVSRWLAGLIYSFPYLSRSYHSIFTIINLSIFILGTKTVFNTINDIWTHLIANNSKSELKPLSFLDSWHQFHVHDLRYLCLLYAGICFKSEIFNSEEQMQFSLLLYKAFDGKKVRIKNPNNISLIHRFAHQYHIDYFRSILALNWLNFLILFQIKNSNHVIAVLIQD